MAKHNKISNLFGWEGKYYTVIGKEPNKNKKSMWLCECDCGNKFYAEACRIKSGRRKSCGCKSKEHRLFHKYENPQDYSWHRLFESYKDHAEKRNLEFNLDFDSFKYFCSQPCYYCLSDLSNTICFYSKKSKRSQSGIINYNGIDRTDTKIGYITPNCRGCCKKCNISKHTMTEKEFVEHIKKLYDNFVLRVNYENSLCK